MDNLTKKRHFKLKMGRINSDNVTEVYKKNFDGYIYHLSDEVLVNGKVITDPLKKILMRFPNEKGEPNIKSAKATGKKSSFSITELDFVEKEIREVNELEPLDFVQTKQKEIYLNYLNEKQAFLKYERRRDFSTWFVGKTDWSEVSFEFTTGKKTPHPQNLKAAFWNSYVNYQIKIDTYFNEFKELPIDFFNELIFDFRQHFPVNNRVIGINYFDDLIEQLIEKYKDQPQQENKTDAPTKEYNSSQFNEHTYNLFCYIVDEYKKDGNIKFINIWYFLKRDIDKTKYKNILFNFTQEKYKEFVKKYDVEIKKFKKADFKYKDDEVGILQNITNDYYTSLKEIENT